MSELKIGDEVMLKEPECGKYYQGKIVKITDKVIRVNLPNGLYAEKPVNKWKKVNDNE